jgi:MoaA/NifB/PqqE/SkfB family radical SAM enzyme
MKSRDGRIGLTRVLLRMASVWGGGVLRTLWRTRGLQAGLVRSRRRRKRALAAEGLHVPMGIAISPTSRCNLACRGCYARFHPVDGEMPTETIDAFIREASDLGVFFFVITGGEPFLRPEMIDLYERYRSVLFLAVTNGTLIDAGTVSRLAGAGNVLPVVSIEGTRGQTDDWRGEGVHGRAIDCMRLFKDARIPFGFSAVVKRESAATLGSDEFVGEMVERGCTVGFFNEFVPVERGDAALVPDGELRGWFAGRVDHLRRRHPIVLLNLPADEYDAEGRCMAVAGGAMHITARGDVEPCPFAHFALENVTRSTFRDVLRSPFLAAIRSHPTVLRCGEIGCSLVNNHATLAAIARRTNARPTNIMVSDGGRES